MKGVRTGLKVVGKTVRKGGSGLKGVLRRVGQVGTATAALFHCLASHGGTAPRDISPVQVAFCDNDDVNTQSESQSQDG